MAIKIVVEPHNGLSLPKVGHLPQGEHTVDLTEADLKGAEGVKIIKAKKQASGQGGQGNQAQAQQAKA